MSVRAVWSWPFWVVLASAVPAAAVDLPANFVVDDVATGFTNPVGITFGPNGWLWVVEQRGVVSVVPPGAAPIEFLDLSDEVHGAGDRGLLGIAVHPDFQTNGYVYLLYTVDPPERAEDDVFGTRTYSRLERWTADPAAGRQQPLPGSRVVLLGDPPSTGFPSCHTSHTIGTLRFGNDGSLLMSNGDGAHFDVFDLGGLDPACFGHGPGEPGFDARFDIGSLRSQHVDVASGKILRLDPITGQGLPDNPFWNGDPDAMRSKVWAMGLRNPYRMTVRPGSGLPGQIYSGDVGGRIFEEIDRSERGSNHGWPCTDGDELDPISHLTPHCATLLDQGRNPFDSSVAVDYAPPVAVWVQPDAHALTGTTFYAGGGWPEEYVGRLLQADYGLEVIRMYAVDAGGDLIGEYQPFATNAGDVVDLVTDPLSGDLYFVQLTRNEPGGGKVRRVRYAFLTEPPVVELDVRPLAGAAPLTVTFDGSASYDPEGGPVTWFWDFGDGNSAGGPSAEHTYLGPGDYPARLVVTDAEGAQVQASARIVVLFSEHEEPFVLPGTQPGELEEALAEVGHCSHCHGSEGGHSHGGLGNGPAPESAASPDGGPAADPPDAQAADHDHADGHDHDHGAEPTVLPNDTWVGSMMANAYSDPLFLAALAIANEDVEDAGSLCLRCHAPGGWLSGRSLPADGAALLPADREGITCAFCHRLDPGADGDPPGPLVGMGQFYLRDDITYQGRREDSQARHETAPSDYVRSSESCAPCHSVSSPVSGHFGPGGDRLGPALPEQRTYEEWAASAFARRGESCQSCHMPRAPGAASGDGVGPLREDVSRHDLAGGSVWMPQVLATLNPALSASYDEASARALEMLQEQSAKVSIMAPEAVSADAPLALRVRVENLTGHKLPTGYPDGRRMWLEVTARSGGLDDEDAEPYFASGVYDLAEADLPADGQLRTYQMELGQVGVGPTFHFLQNDTVVQDTRIPPEGFQSDDPALLPVRRTYQGDDGAWRNWDEAPYDAPPPPAGAERVTLTARLWYQTTTRDYVIFLRNFNHTNDAGQTLWRLWEDTGRATPVLMVEARAERQVCGGEGCPPPSASDCALTGDCAGDPGGGAPGIPLVDEEPSCACGAAADEAPDLGLLMLLTVLAAGRRRGARRGTLTREKDHVDDRLGPGRGRAAVDAGVRGGGDARGAGGGDGGSHVVAAARAADAAEGG